MDFIALANECAPTVAHETMAAIVQVESAHNPYAIGVVGGRLVRQPGNLREAVVTAQALERAGWNFSVGLAQLNRHNLPKFGLGYEQAFEPCANLRVGAKILEDCYRRASATMPQQRALQAALSCYYSGNFVQGFRLEAPGTASYVQKVLKSANTLAPPPLPAIPPIRIAAASTMQGNPSDSHQLRSKNSSAHGLNSQDGDDGGGERVSVYRFSQPQQGIMVY